MNTKVPSAPTKRSGNAKFAHWMRETVEGSRRSIGRNERPRPRIYMRSSSSSNQVMVLLSTSAFGPNQP